MKKILMTIACLAATAAATAQERPLWMRYSAISPDGQTIAFAYKGDIYTVPAAGGKARQLTSNPAYDTQPVWSPDGRRIAFTSAREGSLDVFVMSSEGGFPTRLTTNSGSEYAMGWRDNSHVLFKASMLPTPESNIFVSAKFPQTYEVSTEGGRPRLFSALPMAEFSINGQGDILYQDAKGSEDYFRKHHQSPICRDIWLKSSDGYRKLTDFEGEDRNPLWAADGKSFYYLSEQDGTFNVYRRTLDGSSTQQLTHHVKNPVRYLSLAADGTLCYGYDGEIYTLREGGQPQRVSISIAADRSDRALVRQVLTRGATEIAVSPSGKEIAFVLHGDIYVTATDYATTRQVTDTPEQERSIAFAPDGRSIAYASERGGYWQIYQTRIADSSDRLFTYAATLTEEQLTDSRITSFQPQYSPDGQEIAFIENRGAIRILNLASRQLRTVLDGKYNFSYSDGDLWFDWSPDGRWLLSGYIGNGGYNNRDIALVDASGQKAPFNLTNSGYSEGRGRWALGGKAMLFTSNREGYKNHGGHGSHSDYFLMFFDTEAYERFLMTKEEKALYDEQRKEALGDGKDGHKRHGEKHTRSNGKTDIRSNGKKHIGSNGKKHIGSDGETDLEDDSPKAAEPIDLDLENCRRRIVRMTVNSSALGDAVLSVTGDTLYYQAAFEGAHDLWRHDLLDNKTEIVVKNIGAGRLCADKKLKNLFLSGPGGIKKVELAKGKTTGIDFEAVFNYRPYEERQNLFEHIWQQVKDKFYRADIHGVDWEGYRDIYAKFLPHINNEYDFRDLCGEMLGELNASHTGARYDAAPRLRTARLGVFIDEGYEGDGLRIAEVIKGSPLSLHKAAKAGSVITHIDGQPVKAGADYFPLLEGKTQKRIRLSLRDPQTGRSADVYVRGLTAGAENDLLYERWVERNRRLVDSLSGGRLAYVHIRSMNGDCFRKLFLELLSEDNRLRDAVIVDERHNGGGYLHDDLCHLLSGRQHSYFLAHGKYIGIEPSAQWNKPSCVLICEDDYSNACGFPREYQDLGIGKLIGTPVAGTASSVWWETLVNGVTFGIPQIGRVDIRGDYGENTLLKPEIIVYNTPADYLSGRDRQLEAAVSEMLREAAAFKEKTKGQFVVRQ